jgi:hypothetical protein
LLVITIKPEAKEKKLSQGQHLTILHRVKILPKQHAYIFPLSITIQDIRTLNLFVPPPQNFAHPNLALGHPPMENTYIQVLSQFFVYQLMPTVQHTPART